MAEPPAHRSALRVQRLLAEAGSSSQVVELEDSTRTAVEAAAVLGVKVGQIAKSLVFTADATPVVVVASGADRVDTGALALVLGVSTVRRADPETVRRATGYPIGGVSPVGLPAGLMVVVDGRLRGQGVVWAAAGTPRTVFPTSYRELLLLTGGREAEVAKPG